ncbi:MAG: hypothetical protein BWY98_00842 [Tenericutes bacterium ADurb.BinA155]|jgi:hypothetical protein|nr:MAG: hypothetical protein BWY98_00842 [Tenericutes bacterium ADurb.BinA155]
MSKKTNIIVGLVVAVFVAVAVFVLFANCFATPSGYGAEYGSAFKVMFGSQGSAYNAVPLLIVAFSLYCAAFLTAIVGAFCFGKVQTIVYGLTALMSIGAGVIFLLSVSLFRAVNTAPIGSEAISLGAAPITSSVFAFLGGVLSLFGAYKAIKD